MADTKKATDGPEPYSPSAFDFEQIPDAHDDFINVADFVEFAKALQAPETSPSAEDLTLPQPEPRRFITALNDWAPVRQKVLPKTRRRHKKPPRRGKDETREGFFYGLLKWPFLCGVFSWLAVLGIGYVLTRLYIYTYEHWVSWRGRRQRLRARLQASDSYEDWIKAAKELDTYLHNDEWKEDPDYAYYDSKTVRRVHHQMVKLRKQAEEQEKEGEQGTSDAKSAVEDLRALVEASMKNNFVGFENPRLYSETYYGTKDLVQDFVDEAEKSLQFLLRTTQLDQETKRALFKHLSSNFGRTALCLSGGATFAYYHFGVAKALLDAGLLPEVITGTSGGALVAALLGTRTDEELKKILVPALANRITACSDSTWTWIQRWRKTGARFDSVEWAQRAAWFTRGSMTFKEAYQRSGRILNVSCVPSDPHSPTILVNYITSPDCVIWSAVLASAAVPGILNPVVMMKKNKDGTLAPYSFGHKWKDGSLRTDIPLKALNLHFNVRFSIVSQVNPHINIFFFSSRGSVGRPVTHRRGRGWRGGFIGSAAEQTIKLDLNKWLKVLRHLELLPRPLGQDWSEIWLQRFSGTITIWPKSILSDFYYILTDPTPERLARMIRVGQQSAFPKLKFIANRAKLEHAIHQGRRQLRSHGVQDGLSTAFSEEDLRSLLQRTKSGASEHNVAAYPMSGSESSSSAGPSRPGSPVNIPLGFAFAKPKQSITKRISTEKAQNQQNAGAPDSPSLSHRLSGWWSSLSPQKPRDQAQYKALHSPPPASPYIYHDRPASMYELRSSSQRQAILNDAPPFPRSPLTFQTQSQRSGGSGSGGGGGSFLKELRRQSRVFVDDESDGDDEGLVADYGDAGKRYDVDGGDDERAGHEDAHELDEDGAGFVGDDELEYEGEDEYAAGKPEGVGLGVGLGS